MFKIYLAFLSFIMVFSCQDNSSTTEINPIKESQIAKTPVEKKIKAFGFTLNDFEVVNDTVAKGDFFGSIMDKHGITPNEVYKITHSISDTIFNFKRINVGKPYTILKTKDSLSKPYAFIYENNKIDYTKVFLSDSIYAEKSKKPVTIKTKTASGVINSSLSLTIDEAGLDYMLTNRLADIYQWTIDFFRIQPGDRFKIVYKEKYINDSIYAGIESVDAAVFVHDDKPYYAFEFEVDSITGRTEYFDESAKTLRRFFLKAPVQYSRISSRYSPRRFHPVQKRWKAHKGTDYAASRGTPIWSTADGVVIKSSYTRGNGNYVKIKHTNKYTTQYLHMSKRAVKVGQRVKQGEIIGYVGSTGLATGPHVCYRFWVYGSQVDPYKQDLPDAKPMPESLKPKYFNYIENLKKQLDYNFLQENRQSIANLK
ncbi:peptidoglycan DD-metalloendopeptidase family protein [Flavobacterium sp. CS20]|jgi:murein DD-endopeptidase MepM/ murein hydrolase activator NlpD|uniref:peptidoglycan DD-metalloendopeptidase family protein n=1 Tax=Flavobacterium sp. CS20 TaxID=2775246 RepID=UPI001B3A3A8F|nr:peptidoglycan DD-metalloendopeptidase family protein [Flavobacterium sp. CS20]QTY26561.1 peptidoglycan DD-metalloendopeptidase family protein [Flavobacterium sp. CS20]